MTSDMTPELIQEKLASIKFTGIENPYSETMPASTARKAAVVIPFVRVESQWQLIFIRRTNNVHDRHSGQVAFPGGGVKAFEDTRMAALRETEEEIGVPGNLVHLLGRLNNYMAISNFEVTPYIGILPWPYAYRPDPLEVSRIFTIPWAWLVQRENYEVRVREIPPNPPFQVIYFKEYDGEILWGFTARIVCELARILN